MSDPFGPEVADAETRRREQIPGDGSFALCLTHDVDRPYKTYQSLYYAVTERDPSHLKSLVPGHNPYWSFDRIMRLEADLGVRSAFYFLDEQHLFTDRPRRELASPRAWSLYTGRYDVTDPRIIRVIRELDAGGWEVGLHGSYRSYRSRDRLREEKRTLESVLGHDVAGVRQHHLNLSVPETWRHHAALGLSYDASPGSSSRVGFDHGYGVRRPFDDAFAVFPLTAMELALPIESDPDRAWEVCDRLLREAREEAAVMTVLWHPRFFCADTPNHEPIYRRLIERAQALGAWVGPPGELYASLDHPGSPNEVAADGGTTPGDPGR